MIHWRDVPSWYQARWPNISPEREMACGTTGLIPTHANFHRTLDACQAYRDWMNRAVYFTSMYRSEVHNRAEGGAPRSTHMLGLAADFLVEAELMDDAVVFFQALGAGGIGYYADPSRLHIDFGRVRTWDERPQPLAFQWRGRPQSKNVVDLTDDDYIADAAHYASMARWPQIRHRTWSNPIDIGTKIPNFGG